jgi:peptidoglycan/xylan/chitin deacetylase (PgdA/CDA1 family)
MTVLAFHNTDSGISPGLNNYSPKRLKELLAKLKYAGYKFVSLKDAIADLSDEKTIALTFDDGYQSFYHYALPILGELEVPSTVFIPFGYIGQKARWEYLSSVRTGMHMSRDQIAEVSASCVEVGSHGFSHIDLTGLSERLIKLELERSMKGLEDLTGRQVRFISYPFGRFNGQIESLAAEMGYERGFSLSFYKRSRFSFTVPRFAVYSTDTVYSVMKKNEQGPLRELEKIKGVIMNSYAFGAILWSRLKSQKVLEPG